MNLNPFKTALGVASALALIACGGGGSSGGTPITGGSGGSTPQPSNRAPIVIVDAPGFAFEKGVLRFDATESYDPDNNTSLEIVIEQTSGTGATFLYALGQNNTGFEVWAAPEFDGPASESLTFRVTATDLQGLSSSREFTILIEADDFAGQPVARYTGEVDLVMGNAANIGFERLPNEVMAVRRYPSGLSNLVWLGGNHRFFSTDIILQEISSPIANANFDAIDFIKYNSLQFNLEPSLSNEFTVLEADRDRIRWFYSEGDRDSNKDPIYIESTQMDLEQPCFIRRRTSTGEDFVWVAHKSGGVSLVQITPVRVGDGLARDFTYNTLLKTATDRRLCYIYPTIIDETILPKEVNGQFELYQSALAVDFDKNELVVLGDPRDGGLRYGEITSIPLQTQTLQTLKIVDIISQGEPSRSPNFMLVLLSDGQEGGIHRLVYIKQDSFTGEVSQETFSYEGPPPIGLHLGPMGGSRAGGQFSLDIAITTSGSFGVFFDTIGGGISAPPNYAEPVTFEMTPGGTEAVGITFDDDPFDHELLVNYPDTKTLRVYNID